MSNQVLYNMIAARDARGKNYFHYACEVGSPSLLVRVGAFFPIDFRHLLEVHDYEGSQPIHVAVNKHTGPVAVEIIEELIEMRADIDGKDRLGGDTVLHRAVHNSDYHLAGWLCKQQNITINALNYARQTPYDLAWNKGDKTMMKILEDHGAETEPIFGPCSDDSN